MRQTKIFYYSLSIILGLMMINMNGCSDTRIKNSASKRVLENGLTVIVKEDHKSPLFTIDTWVKAGYYNEPDSVTGISHLLEHMFFKGTEKRGLGEIKGDTKKLGGRFNAGTIYEHTHYYTILPSEYLEEGVEIQSDALRNSTFDDEELSKEKEVVVQEIKRKYDNPSQYSYEKMLDLMFDTHRMGRWRMGTPEQVRGISRNELVDYYKKYYTPDNVILVVVGDVDSSEVYSLIEKYYGDWSPPECKKEISPSESVQRQLRHEIMRSDIKQPYIYMGFKTPGMLNEDTYALQILAYVLGRGKSSRLYKGIVEELQWASTAACELYALEDLGILNINVQPMGENIIDIENEVFGQIRLIKERGIPESELSKAKNNLESAYLFGMEEVTNQSEQLAIFEQYGDYKYLDEHLLKLNAVTVADIKRVAEDYLDISKCSIIEHLPDDMRVEKLKDEEYAKILSNAYARFSIDTSEDTECLRPTGTNIDRDDFPPVKFTLSDNKKIIIKENHSLPIVSVMIGFKGGRCFETPENSGITRLMSSGLIKGSEKYSNDQIINIIEGTGGRLVSYSSRDYFGISIAIPSKYFEPAMEIAADIINNPKFDADDIDAERSKQLAEIVKNRDRMRSYPSQLLYSSIYGDYSYGLPEYGIEDVLKKMTVTQLRDWYRRYNNSDGFYFVVVGDVNRENVKALVSKLFVEIKRGSIVDEETKAPDKRIHSRTVENRDKSQTAQAAGYLTCKRNNDDYYALKILQNIASGMGGRLFTELRDKRSLAYTVYGYNVSFAQSGAFICYIATNPENEYRARRGLINELKKFRDEYVSDEELMSAKAYLAGNYAEFLQTNSSQAGQYLLQEIIGKGMAEVSNYPKSAADVTKEDIMRVAKKYFEDDNLAYGVVRGK